MTVAPGVTATTSMFVLAPSSAFEHDAYRVRFRVTDGSSFRREFDWKLRGPEREESEHSGKESR
jgi:hypothetical protein